MLRKLVSFLLYSNIFIGVCAVALAFTNQLTIENRFYFDKGIWFVFFSTVFTYSFLKLSNPEGTRINNAHRSWAKNNPQLTRNILLISLIGTVCFLVMLQRQAMVIVLLLSVVTAFYGFISLPFFRPQKKLRDFGLLKTFFVALVWSVTTVLVPLSGNSPGADMLLFLLARRFLFVLALTMVFEIKDLKGDSQHRLRTLPAAFGVSNTKLLAQGILLALILINCIQYYYFDLSLLKMAAVNLSLLVSVICIQPVNEETGENWYYFILDGMMLLQFLLVWFAVFYFE